MKHNISMAIIGGMMFGLSGSVFAEEGKGNLIEKDVVSAVCQVQSIDGQWLTLSAQDTGAYISHSYWEEDIILKLLVHKETTNIHVQIFNGEVAGSDELPEVLLFLNTGFRHDNSFGMVWNSPKRPLHMNCQKLL